MTKYKIKPGKIGTAVINAYKKVEENFSETFLERDETNEAGTTLKTGEVAKGVASGYKKIEHGVVEGFKKVETGVVGGYKKIENRFVENFLEPVEPEDEETEETK